ncbi:MAG TPA: SAVED domain-containing protein, partial [Spirochaetales bacterium]|nr:SAVED domain-containing protein [Spirochaetales bacterium]
DKADIQLAIGGLAAVPALFLAGMLVDDETNVTLYDWDRNAKLWRLVDGSDDRKRFELLDGAEVDAGTKEVVLAVSVSYPIDTQALRQTFGASMPIARLTSEEVLADRYWSEEKQQAYVVSLRDAIQKLMSVGVQRIHMVLAAPASLSIRMGMAYDRRLMPDLIVYQYEKTATPPYPWGIQMPTHGHTPAKVVWSDSEQFAFAPRCG